MTPGIQIPREASNSASDKIESYGLNYNRANGLLVMQYAFGYHLLRRRAAEARQAGGA